MIGSKVLSRVYDVWNKQIWNTRQTTLIFWCLIWQMHFLLWSFSGPCCDVRGVHPQIIIIILSLDDFNCTQNFSVITEKKIGVFLTVSGHVWALKNNQINTTFQCHATVSRTIYILVFCCWVWARVPLW